MKKVLAALIVVLLLKTAGAQKVYFIYIQAETNTPFFVKLGDKVFNATTAGYLILPKLVDSVYTFSVGKTGQTAEAKFSVALNKKDHGYLLRDTEGKMSLFDLQTMTLLPALAGTRQSGDAVAKRTDAFAVLLAQAANDPSLLEIHTAVATASTESKKPEPTPAVVITKEPENKTATLLTENNDSAADTVQRTNPITEITKPDEEKEHTVIKSDTVQQAVKTETAQHTAPDEATPYKRSVVTRKSESSTSEGFGITFLDQELSEIDTIRIIIPNQTMALKKEESRDDSKKFLNISDTASAKVDTTAAAANEKISAAEKRKRRACVAEATEKDFLKLRKNMAAKESDEAMISEAQKVFKRSCFTTAQIKNLSSLFLTASGKYHFFDAAYGHVSNQEQYSSLQAELDDAYYVNRFKALVSNQ